MILAFFTIFSVLVSFYLLFDYLLNEMYIEKSNQYALDKSQITLNIAIKKPVICQSGRILNNN